MPCRSILLACFVLIVLAASAVRADETRTRIEQAEALRLAGNYAEASELLKPLAEADPSAALGLARCHWATGDQDTANKLLAAARERFPKNAALPAQSAANARAVGRHDAARKAVDAALTLDEDQLQARWLDAELKRERGKLDQAAAAYQWFIGYYNGHDVERAESLYYTGLGAAQYARWNRLSDQFSFLVNELYPDALAQNKQFWPAHAASAALFLEKYNQAEAAREIERGLTLNPGAAPLLALRAELALQNYELEAAKTDAERALAINGRLLAAQLILADVALANFETREAAEILEKQALPLNRASEATLGRLAAVYLVLDAPEGDNAGSRARRLAEQVQKRNPAPGEFYEAMGDALDRLRKWPHSVAAYEQAIRLFPQGITAPGKLGLIHLRLGDEAAGKKLLETAFELDPFNVRVKNSLAVLDVLDEYETLETEHFIIRFNPKHDALLARHVAEYLEEIYPELCETLDYHPAQKTLFEIFSRAKNTSGHGWFSARMVGLPHVHTIAACAGKMVAVTSPGELPEKVSWARVLKHELVHVINLQQTDFNIPHWFTEALAVLHEESPRSEEWNRMLARRVPEGDVFTLDTINLGFIRPESSEDWQMAYCQSEIYAEYLLERFGDDALAKMLRAYADNRPTAEAIRESFGVSVEDFEQGYSERLKQIVAELPAFEEEKEARDFAALEQTLRDDPKDADANAELARVFLDRKSLEQAGKHSRAALAVDAEQPTALYVEARLQMAIGRTEEAVELLEKAVQGERVAAEPLRLLAAVRFKQEDFEAAAKLYEQGRQAFPGDTSWLKGLARVHLKTKDNAALRPLLTTLAEQDPDELPMRKMLARLALEEEDFEAAERWAREAVHIDVSDADLHRMWAEALVGMKRPEAAIPRYEVALEIEPNNKVLREALENLSNKSAAGR